MRKLSPRFPHNNVKKTLHHKESGGLPAHYIYNDYGMNMMKRLKIFFAMMLATGMTLMLCACGGTKGPSLDKETKDYLATVVEKANAKIAKLNSEKDGNVKTSIALALEKDKLVFKMILPKTEFTDEELLQVAATGESFKSMQQIMFGLWFLAIDEGGELFGDAFFAKLSEKKVATAFVIESQNKKILMEVPIDLSNKGAAKKKAAIETASANTPDDNPKMTLQQWVDKFNGKAPLKATTPRLQRDMTLSGKMEQMSLKQIKLDSSRIVFDFQLADTLGRIGGQLLTSLGTEVLDMVIHFTSENFGKENNLFPLNFLKALANSKAEIVFQFTGKDKVSVETTIPKDLLPIPYEETPNEKVAMIDGFPTVTIGNQTWMAENLNIETPGSVCYDNDPEQCKNGGRLYPIDEARTVCPEGWHLPDTSEFNTLIREVGDIKKLISANYNEWTKKYAGTDDYGFRLRPTGVASDSSFTDGNFGTGIRPPEACEDCYIDNAYLWTSTIPKKKKDHYNKYLGFFVWLPKYSIESYNLSENHAELMRMSVRCIKGEPVVKAKTFETFTDPRDNKKYKIVEINGQKWMAENLNFKSPRSICYDADDAMCEKFGRLYNLSEAQTVCPAGWHLPDTSEFKKLLNDAGSANALLYDEYDDWHGVDAEKEVGFEMRPSGVLEYQEFSGIERNPKNRDEIVGGRKAALWTSTPSLKKVNSYGMRGLGYYISFPHFEVKYFYPTSEEGAVAAYSVRCAMGDPVPTEDPNKLDSIVDKRDNRTYKTVIINGKTWMAENLKYKTDSSVCYNHDEQMCEKYGRLYSGEDALKTCPAGWHLPSKEEWGQLRDFISRSTSFLTRTEWKPEWKDPGTDDYNFSVLPSGYYTYPTPRPKWTKQKEPYPEHFSGLDYEANFWTSSWDKYTWNSETKEVLWSFLLRLDNASFRYGEPKTSAQSIRCIKDE